MGGELGKLLERLRRTAGVSRADGAQRSGVSRMTLFRWERGDNIPREYELHAVLNAYEASAAQRRAIYAARDRETLARLTQSGRRTPPPQTHLGDFLAALRGRAGMTQAEVAARAGVSRFALSAWENLNSWPNDATLHRLAYALNATDTELITLTTPPTPETTRDDRSRDALYHDARRMMWTWPALHQSEPELLRLMARLRPFIPESSTAHYLLKTLEHGYAVLLTYTLRHAESARWLRRAAMHTPTHPDANFVAFQMQARSIIEREGVRRTSPDRRLRVARRRWQQQQSVYVLMDEASPTWKVTFRLEAASALYDLGDDDSALRLASSAFALSGREGDPQSEMRLYRYGELLHAAGRHDRIADLFPAYLGRSVFADVHIRYYLGLAARAHGDESAADALLRQALTDAVTQSRSLLERDIRQSLLPSA